MTHDKDKILLRAKDIVIITSVIVLMGMLAGPLRKIFKLEDMIKDVDQLKIDDMTNKTNIAVINAQYTDIGKELEKINWQLGRIRMRGNRNDE